MVERNGSFYAPASAVDRLRRHGDSVKLIGLGVAGGEDLDDPDR
jgi:hypothetical protein